MLRSPEVGKGGGLGMRGVCVCVGVGGVRRWSGGGGGGEVKVIRH